VLNFQSIKQKLNVSEPTLTDYIKTLETDNRIEHFEKPEDRRHTWYRIKPQSIKAVDRALLKYEAVKFIKNIEEPMVTYLKGKDGKSSISIFLSDVGNVDKNERKPLEITYKGYAIGLNSLAKRWFNDLEKVVKVPHEGYKIAIVFTKEK
jgi:DNA-binding MarR family transcriptional regulator